MSRAATSTGWVELTDHAADSPIQAVKAARAPTIVHSRRPSGMPSYTASTIPATSSSGIAAQPHSVGKYPPFADDTVVTVTNAITTGAATGSAGTSAAGSEARARPRPRRAERSTVTTDRSSVRGLCLGEQPVAHPPHVEHERSLAGRGELPAQSRGVRIERSRPAERAEAPHFAEELFFREHAVGLRGELEEQLVLLRRQVDARPADGDPARRPVDLDLPDLKPLGRRRRRPAQDGSDPREELVVKEGPPDEVVGAALERPHAVDGVGLGPSDHDQRDLAVPRPALLEGGGVPEEDEVGARPLRELERLAARGRAEDVEAVVGQVTLEKAPSRGLRLGDEDGIRHTRDATGAPPPQLDVLCRDSATNHEQLPRPTRARPERSRP